MKDITQFYIQDGSFALFNIFKGSEPQVLNEYNEWAASYYERTGDIGPTILMPTWNYQFESPKQLCDFILTSFSREGYYLVAKRGNLSIYEDKFVFGTFGVAYCEKPFFKELHHWTDINGSFNTSYPIL